MTRFGVGSRLHRPRIFFAVTVWIISKNKLNINKNGEKKKGNDEKWEGGLEEHISFRMADKDKSHKWRNPADTFLNRLSLASYMGASPSHSSFLLNHCFASILPPLLCDSFKLRNLNMRRNGNRRVEDRLLIFHSRLMLLYGSNMGWIIYLVIPSNHRHSKVLYMEGILSCVEGTFCFAICNGKGEIR